jgi:hypothetical protein
MPSLALQLHEDTEAALLARWRTGDMTAGHCLLRREIQPLRRYFSRRVPCRADAEDLAQRTFTQCEYSILGSAGFLDSAEVHGENEYYYAGNLVGGIRDIGSVDHGIPSLEPGEYFLRVSRPVADDAGHFEIVIDPLE